MTTIPTRPVLVGVDGLPGSSGAVRYAVMEARRRQAPLQLVHVIPDFFSVGPPVPLSDLDRIGVDILERQARSVREVARDLTVTTTLVHGGRSTGLVRAAEAAQLLVIGRETRHGVERFYTGTVTAAVAAHAPCDVVVVPSFWVDADPYGLVVVGIKTGRNSHELLSQAFGEASARGAALRVVTAWHVADPYFDSVEVRTHASEWEQRGTELLVELTHDWRAAFPDVPVETRVVHGPAARMLLRESAGSDLLVLSRRRFTLPPYGQLGGVGHDVLRLSDVPVHVVPYAADEPEPADDLVLEEAGAPVK